MRSFGKASQKTGLYKTPEVPFLWTGTFAKQVCISPLPPNKTEREGAKEKIWIKLYLKINDVKPKLVEGTYTINSDISLKLLSLVVVLTIDCKLHLL